VNEIFESRGVEGFSGSVALVRQLRAAGPWTGVVTSSGNCEVVLAAAKIQDLFEVSVLADEIPGEERAQAQAGRLVDGQRIARSRPLSLGSENGSYVKFPGEIGLRALLGRHRWTSRHPPTGSSRGRSSC
jgi:hypothetical protein